MRFPAETHPPPDPTARELHNACLKFILATSGVEHGPELRSGRADIPVPFAVFNKAALPEAIRQAFIAQLKRISDSGKRAALWLSVTLDTRTPYEMHDAIALRIGTLNEKGVRSPLLGVRVFLTHLHRHPLGVLWEETATLSWPQVNPIAFFETLMKLGDEAVATR